MLLAQAIHWKGERHEMAGVLPFDVEVRERPQGHGYADLKVDAPNPFYPEGLTLQGHEFHYSRLMEGNQPLSTALKLNRGVGVGQGRDGIQKSRVLASYTHIHALGVPGWGEGVVQASRSGRPN